MTKDQIEQAIQNGEWLSDEVIDRIDGRGGLDSGALPSWSECIALVAEVKQHRHDARREA